MAERCSNISKDCPYQKIIFKGWQKPWHGPDPTSLILPLWRSPAGRTWQNSKCVFMYSGSQESRGCSYQADFKQSLGRTTAQHRGLCLTTPCHLHVWDQSVGVKEGRKDMAPMQPMSDHISHAASIRPPAEECLTGTAGNTQQPLHSQTTSAGGWELALMFYSSKLLFPTPEICTPLYTTEAVQFPLV